RLRVPPAEDRRLRRRVGGRHDAVVVVDPRAGRELRAVRPHQRATLAGGAARPRLFQRAADGPGWERAVAVLPRDAAVNAATQFGMVRSWGFQRRPVVLAVGLTTLWNQFVTFGFPLIAIGALSLEGGHQATLGPVALACLLIVAVLAGSIAAIL